MAVELVYHASRGRTAKVIKLLEACIHPDACNSNGETALFHAVLAGKIKTAKVLLKYGADPNRCSQNGLSPVNACCLQDNVTALALLVKYGGNLDKTENSTNESAFVSAQRYRSTKIIKYITKLKEDAIMSYRAGEVNDVINGDGSNERKQNSKIKEFPGDFASLPCIDIEDLKTLHDGKRFLFSAPHVTFRSGIWHRVEVTIKTLNKREYAENMRKEMEFLRVIRHPNIAYLLAVITGPVEDKISSVLEHFHLGSLNRILHHNADETLNVFERLHILLDISKAMVYLHGLNIIHCYINSYSVLLYGKCQAKLGNFEHAQKPNPNARNELEVFASVSHVVEQHPWMCWEELSGYPASKYGDVYSFGALLWECLTQHIPWSWLENDKTVIVAVCEEYLQLPILEQWPDYITDVLTQCLGMEEERPDFYFIRDQLEYIRTSGWLIKVEELDHLFEEWLHGTAKRKPSSRGRTISGPLASKISWNISSFSIGNIDLSSEDDSKVLVLCSRRKSSICGNGKHRRKTIDVGLAGALNALHCSENQIRFERDTDNYGIEIAEQLSFVRGIWKRAKCHSRHRWAKEVTIRRKLEGDIERVNVKKQLTQNPKSEGRKQGRRIRRLSHGAESIARLRNIASKYGKWDWARYTTGHAYSLPEEKYELLSDEEYDENEIEHFPMETGGTFVQYQDGSVKECQIVPNRLRGISLGQIPESELSDSDSDIFEETDHGKKKNSDEEMVQKHWQKELEEECSDFNENESTVNAENRRDKASKVAASENKDITKTNIDKKDNEPDNILDEFSSWLDNMSETNQSTSIPAEKASDLDPELVTRQNSRKEFLEKMVEKYNSQLLLYKTATTDEDHEQNKTSLLEELMETYDNATRRDLHRSLSNFIERTSRSGLAGQSIPPKSKSDELCYHKRPQNNLSESRPESKVSHKDAEQDIIIQGANGKQLSTQRKEPVKKERVSFTSIESTTPSNSDVQIPQTKRDSPRNKNQEISHIADHNHESKKGKSSLTEASKAVSTINSNDSLGIGSGDHYSQMSNDRKVGYDRKNKHSKSTPSEGSKTSSSIYDTGAESLEIGIGDQCAQNSNGRQVGYDHQNKYSKSPPKVSKESSCINSSRKPLEIERGDQCSHNLNDRQVADDHQTKYNKYSSSEVSKMFSSIDSSKDSLDIEKDNQTSQQSTNTEPNHTIKSTRRSSVEKHPHKKTSSLGSSASILGHAINFKSTSSLELPGQIVLTSQTKMPVAESAQLERVDSWASYESGDLEAKFTSDEPDMFLGMSPNQQQNDMLLLKVPSNTKLSRNDSWTSNSDEDTVKRKVSHKIEDPVHTSSPRRNEDKSSSKKSSLPTLSRTSSWESNEEDDVNGLKPDRENLESKCSGNKASVQRTTSQQTKGEFSFFEKMVDLFPTISGKSNANDDLSSQSSVKNDTSAELHPAQQIEGEQSSLKEVMEGDGSQSPTKYSRQSKAEEDWESDNSEGESSAQRPKIEYSEDEMSLPGDTVDRYETDLKQVGSAMSNSSSDSNLSRSSSSSFLNIVNSYFLKDKTGDKESDNEDLNIDDDYV